MSREPTPIQFDPNLYSPYTAIACQILYVKGVYFNAPRLEWFQEQVGVIRSREDALNVLQDHGIGGRDHPAGRMHEAYAVGCLNSGELLGFEIVDAEGNNSRPVLLVPAHTGMQQSWTYDPASSQAIKPLWFAKLWQQKAPGSGVMQISAH